MADMGVACSKAAEEAMALISCARGWSTGSEASARWYARETVLEIHLETVPAEMSLL